MKMGFREGTMRLILINIIILCLVGNDCYSQLDTSGYPTGYCGFSLPGIMDIPEEHQFKNLEEAFKNPESVEILKIYIGKKELEFMDRADTLSFSRFKNLVYLKIYPRYVSATDFEEVLADLVNLEKLNYLLTSASVKLPYIKSLETLVINSSVVSVIHESIKNQISISKLDIYCNNLTRLPESLGNLDQLICLKIYGNRMERLPESLGNLRNLRTFQLHAESLIGFPESIGGLTNLEFLYVSSFKLSYIPDSFGNLKQLIGLYIFPTNLEYFPIQFCQLDRLYVITLEVNNVKEFPAGIENLSQLRFVSISKTRKKRTSKKRKNKPVKKSTKYLQGLLPNASVLVTK